MTTRLPARLAFGGAALLCAAWAARDAARVLDLPVPLGATIAGLIDEIGVTGLAVSLAAPGLVGTVSLVGVITGAIALARRVRPARARRRAHGLREPAMTTPGRH